MAFQPNTRWEDVWIPTSCGQCYCMCGIRVRKQDGVVTEVGEIRPRHGTGPYLRQRTRSPQLLYDPYRVNYP